MKKVRGRGRSPVAPLCVFQTRLKIPPGMHCSQSFSAITQDIFWVDTTRSWCLACLYIVCSFCVSISMGGNTSMRGSGVDAAASDNEAEGGARGFRALTFGQLGFLVQPCDCNVGSSAKQRTFCQNTALLLLSAGALNLSPLRRMTLREVSLLSYVVVVRQDQMIDSHATSCISG